MQIESGAGQSYVLEIDKTLRAKTRSVIESGAVEAAVDGHQFIVTSGNVTLTSASASAVFWYQNEEDFSLLMDRIIFSAGVSTGGTTNVCAVNATINPTGLGSGSSTEIIDVNSNFGSSRKLDTSSSEIGAEAATVTGGTAGPGFQFPDKLTSTFGTQIFMPKGTGIAFAVTPPASNTSIVVSVGINVHKINGI